MTEAPPFLRRVSIRNYKSIAECDVELGRFNVIVGRNGSGKSNFLDAIRFVAESLETSLDHAVRSRGGIEDVLRRRPVIELQAAEVVEEVQIDNGSGIERVLRRPPALPAVLSIELQFRLADGGSGTYCFEVGHLLRRRNLRVVRESLWIDVPGRDSIGFETIDGELTRASFSSSTTNTTLPPNFVAQAPFWGFPRPVHDRLYLVTLSGLSEFREAYDSLTMMHTYNIAPEQIRIPHQADASEVLRRYGSNLASIVGRMADDHPILMQRVHEYLRAVVPQITSFGRASVDGYDSLSFRVDELGTTLHSGSMSDGTLRTVGNLIAVMQLLSDGRAFTVVGLEEPEMSLHPAATGALVDALREASVQTQVIVTSHSPDLLDLVDPLTDTLLVAEMIDGRTEIGPVDAASATAISDHLYTAGELLRMDQLAPRSRQASEPVLQTTGASGTESDGSP